MNVEKKIDIDDEGIRTWRALTHVHNAVIEAIERDLQSHKDLPLVWFEVLLRLGQAPEGALRLQDLAEQILLSRSGVTRLVDRLEAADLIQRANCPHDRRGTYAVLTDAGRERLQQALPHVLQAVEEHFASHLRESETKLLEAVLTRVLEANGYKSGSCLPDGATTSHGDTPGKAFGGGT